MNPPTPSPPRRHRLVATAALLAAAGPALARAGTTLTWDTDPAQPGAQGGPGTWADGAPGWLDGSTNVTWNNANVDSALFGGTSGGAVTLSGTVAAKYLTFDTAGYTLSGGQLSLGAGAGIDSGVHANADVTIGSDIRTAFGSDGWIKDGAGTLTLTGNNNVASAPFHLRSGTLAFANKANSPRSIFFDGDPTSRLLYTGGGASVDIGSALNVVTFGTIDVPGTATRLNLVSEIRSTGSTGNSGILVKRGAGTFSPQYATSFFSGSVRIDEGTLLLDRTGTLNARPIALNGGRLALQANTPTDFASPITTRGDGNVIHVDYANPGAITGASHAVPSLNVVSGTLDLTTLNGWGLAVGGMTNAGTINLGYARLTVTQSPVTARVGAPTGTFRFGHDPTVVHPDDPAAHGLWFRNPGLNAVNATFESQTFDADLLVGVGNPSGGTGSNGLMLMGSWRGGRSEATNTLAITGAGGITFTDALHFNNLTAGLSSTRPLRVWGPATPGGGLEFARGFVADHTANGDVDDGLGEIQLFRVNWNTYHSQSLPSVVRLAFPNGPAGGFVRHRAGLVLFDNFVSTGQPSGVTWNVMENDQTYDGGLFVRESGTIRLTKNLTLTGRLDPYAENQIRIARDKELTVWGPGTLTLSGDAGFAFNSTISAVSSRIVFDTDPGAGWYPGLYTRHPDDPLLRTATPFHGLNLSVSASSIGPGSALFNAPVSRLGSLSLSGSTATVSPSLPGAQKVLSIAQRIAISDDSTLDLTDNAAVLLGNENNTPGHVRDLIVAGRLRSSVADAAHALGFARAGDVLTPSPVDGGSTFLGLNVNPDDVLVRYTLLGDADLDGHVAFADLLALARNYGHTSVYRWNLGDFNYDAAVDFADLLALAKNYNTSLPPGPPPWASAAFTHDLAAAFAAVPEPSTATIALAACGFALTARRRRRPAR